MGKVKGDAMLKEKSLVPEECDFCDELCAVDIPLLQGIPDDQKRELLAGADRVQVPRASLLFQEGDPADMIWIIRCGQVKLCRYEADGREQIIGIFDRYEAIWEGLFLDNSTYPYSAECLTPVEACGIHLKALQAVLASPEVAMDVIVMLSRKLHDANIRNVLLTTRKPESRVAGFLLYRKERSTEAWISLKLEDIAASLNLRPETVSRKLRELEKLGLIERIGRGRLHILDYGGLKALYDGDADG
ncbi:Crp/Fnr family transcriptional regulator [Pseudoramibacter faecis]|uniref:Crp/Fnr family transcriptional regulator n=1 Tax=Pseudoramibacter faecis TaxID=3108534 RepID=UPI002E772DEA|nr:Crp/Fnr family transcriptional regulator [Pseudoramibacter sp. HA2172]